MIKKLLDIILSGNLFFQSLPKKEIIFYSENTFNLVGNNFDENKSFILHNNLKKGLNFFPFIKSIVFHLFSWKPKFYFFEIIKKVEPDFFITIIDNDLNLLEFKEKFPNLVFIVIQNGYRYDTEYDNYFNKLKKLEKQKYKIDYFFSFNENFGNYLKNIFKVETISCGSFANNSIPISNKKKSKSILFISEWGPFKTPFHKNKIGYKKFHECDVFFIKYLSKFCIKNDYQFFILGRPQTQARMKDEINFYNFYLNKDEWKYIRPETKQKASYIEIDKHEIVASITSTLGYESLSRKNKTIIFDGRHGHCFGWPKKLNTNGPFWTTEYDTKKLDNIMHFLRTVDDDSWIKVLNPIIKEMMFFDKDNKIFFQKLKNIKNLKNFLR